MSFLSYFRAAAVAAVLSIAAVPALAQSLTTTYAGGNGQDGVLFDLTPAVNMTIQSFDAHMGQSCGYASSRRGVLAGGHGTGQR